MKLTNDLNTFVEVADQGNFSQAAQLLHLTPAAISASIKRLEAQLGFALFVRSTRHLRLTSEGEILFARVKSAIHLIQEGIDIISEAKGELAGTLRLSAPSDIGRNSLLHWLDLFCEQHPKVKIELELSDEITNLYSQHIDIAIRYGLLPDSNFIALPVCPENRRILCASPDYLMEQPEIKTPSDLHMHSCLCYMMHGRSHNKWTFERNGQKEIITVSAHCHVNDGEVVRRWIKNGKGIGYKSLLEVAQDISEGSLVPILSDWKLQEAPVYLVCADKRILSPLMKALHQFLKIKSHEQIQQVAYLLTD